MFLHKHSINLLETFLEMVFQCQQEGKSQLNIPSISILHGNAMLSHVYGWS
jgi:hypothetical protein